MAYAVCYPKICLTNYLMCFKLNLAYRILDSGPHDTSVVVDKMMTLPCRIEKATTNAGILVHWEYFSVREDTTHKRIIYNGVKFFREFDPGFEINQTSPGQYDLTTPNVRYPDAGTYFCQIGKQTFPAAELVVVGEKFDFYYKYCH